MLISAIVKMIVIMQALVDGAEENNLEVCVSSLLASWICSSCPVIFLPSSLSLLFSLSYTYKYNLAFSSHYSNFRLSTVSSPVISPLLLAFFCHVVFCHLIFLYYTFYYLSFCEFVTRSRFFCFFSSWVTAKCNFTCWIILIHFMACQFGI